MSNKCENISEIDAFFNFYSSEVSYDPNLDIENTFIPQSLDMSSKSKKYHITNKVTRHFLSSLYTTIDYNLNRVSKSGFGHKETK